MTWGKAFQPLWRRRHLHWMKVEVQLKIVPLSDESGRKRNHKNVVSNETKSFVTECCLSPMTYNARFWGPAWISMVMFSSEESSLGFVHLYVPQGHCGCHCAQVMVFGGIRWRRSQWSLNLKFRHAGFSGRVRCGRILLISAVFSRPCCYTSWRALCEDCRGSERGAKMDSLMWNVTWTEKCCGLPLCCKELSLYMWQIFFECQSQSKYDLNFNDSFFGLYYQFSPFTLGLHQSWIVVERGAYWWHYNISTIPGQKCKYLNRDKRLKIYLLIDWYTVWLSER